MLQALEALESLLVIGAHPDDIEIGCGGSILRLLQEYDLHVHWIVLSGSESRRAEALESAKSFLAHARSSEIEIASYRDSFFPGSYAEIKDHFHDLARRVSPDVIFSHRRDDLHQDHRLLGELTWNAFRSHLILEYEIPKYEGDLSQPNFYVTLAESHANAKVSAILEFFESQRDKGLFTNETLWSLMRLRGLEAGCPSGLAEGFHCRKLVYHGA